MIALLSLLLVVLFSIIIVRIGTVALKMTGLSRDVAAFQAQSAFSGVGFTTSESEYVVSHPVRRRIIRVLMLLGSAGLTSAMATLVLTFINTTQEEMIHRAALLLVGVIVLWLFARSSIIDKWMSKVIERALERFTNIKLYDYEQLLGLSKGYTIATFKVRVDSWLANKRLGELGLDEEGVLILGVYRNVDGREIYIGAPHSGFLILPGDMLICYGPEDTLKELSRRIRGPEGDAMHREAVNREKIRRMEEARSLEETAQR